jgi:cell wall-associated NlpC family hydrolase
LTTRPAGRISRISRRVLGIATVVVVGSGVVYALPAAAAPASSVAPAATPGGSGDGSGTQPSTADGAKQAWLAAADKAEVANEQLLDAQSAQRAAESKATDAQVAVARTHLAAGLAQSASVKASAELASYQQQLAAFASASFRGARLGQLTALLSAKSSTDYLDEVASLDQVAGHTKALMASAVAAKKSAASAASSASQAAAAAETAKTSADAAVAKATAATKAVAERKASLDAQVATYHKLFDSLSAKEREQAIAAQQAAWEQQAQAAAAAASSAAASSASAAAAAKQQVQAFAAAPAQQSTPSSSSSSSSSPTSSSSSSSASTSGARSRAQVAVNAALTKLGYPYVYGAAGPGAFDCSGLTSWAWAQAGVSIPHSSYAQSLLPSVPLSQLQPGDLVTYYSPVHHVALYIGNGQIIDAATESRPIYITSVYRGGPNPTGHRVNY